MDTRAQGAIGIARLFLALIVGAIVFWIVSLVSDPLLNGSRNATTNQTANTATDWLGMGVDYIPVIMLLISFFGVIVGAIYVREVLG